MLKQQAGRRWFAISRGAVVARINRRLAKSYEVLKKTRGEQLRMEVGEYYILDYRRNFIIEKDVDPVELGQRLGVITAAAVALGLVR